ncbi:hypothetical protein KQI76_02585 [Amphibacillus sp. MSJ-3]|uniref:hypothetical protein n=1 Tax=Amphibacillus sp. MSJ-3 TaxID=2841505 RepID=UPI001C0E9CA9|nr:hypothetical protein [Amphibacillus sp. MSJ-3]MBU5594040.1 hypothetical protein [Amphibacillus sp. MSJ-3]
MEQLIYFSSAHTSAGYQDLLASNLIGLDHIFLIEGATTKERSEFVRIFFDRWRARGEKIELILNSIDHTVMSGVINRRLSCAIIDRTQHLNYPIKALGVIEHLVDLSSVFNQKDLLTNREQILKFQHERDRHIQEAHKAFARGLDLHDQLEKIYIHAMDFNKANLVTDQLIDEIFQNETSQKIKPIIRHRFLGASTANGVIDFIDQLTEQLGKRYLIKGRAGSGKSTLLRKIVAEAERRHFSIEVYHCGFDPDSLDMVIIRELGIAIFDSTAPHEYEPNRHGDQLIDLYQTTIAHGTDEKYHEEISHLTIQYKYFIQHGTRLLAKALEVEKKLESIYQQSLDSNAFAKQIDQFTENVEKSL